MPNDWWARLTLALAGSAAGHLRRANPSPRSTATPSSLLLPLAAAAASLLLGSPPLLSPGSPGAATASFLLPRPPVVSPSSSSCRRPSQRRRARRRAAGACRARGARPPARPLRTPSRGSSPCVWSSSTSEGPHPRLLVPLAFATVGDAEQGAEQRELAMRVEFVHHRGPPHQRQPSPTPLLPDSFSPPSGRSCLAHDSKCKFGSTVMEQLLLVAWCLCSCCSCS